MITGYDLINGYYEDEKLYSTGDDELDDLLEKAFCEGYEYAQKEFDLKDDIKEALKNNDEDELKRLKKKAKRGSVGIGAGIGAGAGTLNGIRNRKYISRELSGIQNKRTKHIVGGLGIGLGLAGTSGIGAAIGAGVGKSKYNRALKKAQEELEEEKKNDKK